MTTPPRRRWFRFSLRTFFVLIALIAVAIWVAREVAIVRERRAVYLWLVGHSEHVWTVKPYEGDRVPGWFWGWTDIEPTWPRSWFGDERSFTEVWYPPSATTEQLDRVKAAFPEATVEPWPE